MNCTDSSKRPKASYNCPIDMVIPDLKKALLDNPAIILKAPPGAGKTTRVPLALLDIMPPHASRIVMLEPRRIAAVSAARWMAKTLGEEAGETVGYSIRFESAVSAKTRLEVVTEGILSRRLQKDQSLEGVGLVIFDEFHERSMHADLALALCFDVQRHLRNDLKILIMSATLACGNISEFLGNAPVITSEGRSFPVEIRYHENIRHEPLAIFTAKAIINILGETSGDILVFLPGAGDIRAAAEMLKTWPGGIPGDPLICPLYGDLPFDEQQRAILPCPPRRKIVIATNIAETSLTIEGVTVVIDAGMSRRMQFDPATDMNRLITVRASRSSAEQRAGRAGRLAPGVCYRLYSKHTFDAMIPHTPPEILVSDITGLVLELALWGVKDAAVLSFLDPPPAAAFAAARQLLVNLGALDVAGSVTQTGIEMARLPLHPRLARLVIQAQREKMGPAGSDVAALLSERDVFRHADQRIARHTGASDITERVEILHRWRDRNGAIPDHADRGALRSVDRTAGQLARILHTAPLKRSASAQFADHLLLCAYPDRIGKLREGEGDRYLLANGKGVKLSPKSGAGKSPYIVAVNVDAGKEGEGLVHIAGIVGEDDIRRECTEQIERVRTITWDGRENRVIAIADDRIGALSLSSKPFVPSDEETIPVLCSAVKDNFAALISFSGEARQLQARVNLVRSLFPEEDWPDISNARLAETVPEWLAPFLSGVRTSRDLVAINTLDALRNLITHRKMRQLEELAPRQIEIPSGRIAALDYTAGDAPVLAVKLQEMFGCGDTPVIARGRIKVLIHLLSPAGRPLQVTRDLKGFWQNSYPLVKKEMKGRYPKHPWPDDPWNAVPTRKTKKNIR